MRGIAIDKRKKKALFVDAFIVHIENPRESTENYKNHKESSTNWSDSI